MYVVEQLHGYHIDLISVNIIIFNPNRCTVYIYYLLIAVIIILSAQRRYFKTVNIFRIKLSDDLKEMTMKEWNSIAMKEVERFVDAGVCSKGQAIAAFRNSAWNYSSSIERGIYYASYMSGRVNISVKDNYTNMNQHCMRLTIARHIWDQDMYLTEDEIKKKMTESNVYNYEKHAPRIFQIAGSYPTVGE